MRWLAGEGPRVVSLWDLLDVPPDDDAVALTFDDGFANFRTEGLPLLVELGLPATMFVVTDRVGLDNGWDGRDYPGVPRLPLMTWDEVAELPESGVELGGHSRSHPDLTALLPGELADEVHLCAEELASRTGTRPRAFAYPFGAYDEAVVAEVAARYDLAVTTRLSAVPEDPSPHTIPRLDTFYLSRPGQLESWGSWPFRARLEVRSGLREVRSRWRRYRSGG